MDAQHTIQKAIEKGRLKGVRHGCEKIFLKSSKKKIKFPDAVRSHGNCWIGLKWPEKRAACGRPQGLFVYERPTTSRQWSLGEGFGVAISKKKKP